MRYEQKDKTTSTAGDVEGWGTAIINESDTITCPYCAEAIKRDAVRASIAHQTAHRPGHEHHYRQHYGKKSPPCHALGLLGPPMGGVMAGTSDCYAIKDGGKRAYCLATVKRDYGYCYRIKGSDLRNQCLAEIKDRRDRCCAIKDQDARKACLAKQ